MGTTTSIRAVIFDYGQVLSLPPRAELFAAMAALCGVSGDQFQHYYWSHRDDYDRGHHDLESYWSPLLASSATPATPERLQRLGRLDTENWTRLDDRMMAWVALLQRSGWKTAILSNMPDPLLQPMKALFPWMQSFTHLTFSCEVGAVKPDPSIYRHCLEGLGVEAGEALFLDDRAVNAEAARRLGLHALQYHSMERLALDLVQNNYPLPSPLAVADSASR